MCVTVLASHASVGIPTEMTFWIFSLDTAISDLNNRTPAEVRKELVPELIKVFTGLKVFPGEIGCARPSRWFRNGNSRRDRALAGALRYRKYKSGPSRFTRR